MNYGSLLSHFKEIEQPDNIVPLIDDVSLRNGICAWKSVVISYKDMSDCNCDSESSQWEWMWANIEFDLTKFAIVAGCRQQDIKNIFIRLQGLRLIYPDGTINNYATKYLQAIIMAKLPKKK